MESVQNDNPFLNLLRDDTLKKIKIDSELIPVFKIVISKINDYFIKNGLMNIKDWNTLFHTYLLTENSSQYHIRLSNFENMEKLGGLHDKQNSEILIRYNSPEELCETLCHEFIHFLVGADSTYLGWKPTEAFILNEGLTQLLTNEVLSLKDNLVYDKEVQLAKIYCELAKDKEPIRNFLCDKFIFENESDLQSIGIRSRYYANTEDKIAYRDVQKYVIRSLIDINSIDSIPSYISLVNILCKRHDYDFEYINSLFDEIVDNLASKIEKDENRRETFKRKLIIFQKAADYYQMYGEKEVAIYLIDDLRIAFDTNGKYYGEFPSDGEHKRGQIGFDGVSKITVIHNDKTYVINTKKMNCKNWKAVYDKMYNALKNEFDLLNMQALENSESQASIKK